MNRELDGRADVDLALQRWSAEAYYAGLVLLRQLMVFPVRSRLRSRGSHVNACQCVMEMAHSSYGGQNFGSSRDGRRASSSSYSCLLRITSMPLVTASVELNGARKGIQMPHTKVSTLARRYVDKCSLPTRQTNQKDPFRNSPASLCHLWASRPITDAASIQDPV